MKRIVILLALATMVAATSATAQYEGAGKIGAQRQGPAQVKAFTVVPPTQSKLLYCRIEVTWYDGLGWRYQWTDCHAMATTTVGVPTGAQAAPWFNVTKRCFWQPTSGTVWKTSNTVTLNN
jgi:hypothetical protein